MPIQKLKDYLDSNHVKYLTMSHSPAFTAEEVAASAHVPGRELAKTVMVKSDGKMAMVVLAAHQKVDFGLLEGVMGRTGVGLADEEEFKTAFPDCDVGAMPPFGNLYEMEIFVDESLQDDEQISFNAGTHTELIKLAYSDFEKLAKPKVGRIAVCH